MQGGATACNLPAGTAVGGWPAPSGRSSSEDDLGVASTAVKSHSSGLMGAFRRRRSPK